MTLAKLWIRNKTIYWILILMAAACMLAGCAKKTQAEDPDSNKTMVQPELKENGSGEPGRTEIIMRLYVNDEELSVAWEDNESVDALRELVSKEALTIEMSMYGGFEQVGSIGQDLTRNDKQTTTSAGDIVLYSGNQIVLFYGSNSWSYTRLGHIDGKSEEELRQLLGNGNVSITINFDE